MWGGSVIKVNPGRTNCGDYSGLTLEAASLSSFCFWRSVSMDIGWTPSDMIVVSV